MNVQAPRDAERVSIEADSRNDLTAPLADPSITQSFRVLLTRLTG